MKDGRKGEIDWMDIFLEIENNSEIYKTFIWWLDKSYSRVTKHISSSFPFLNTKSRVVAHDELLSLFPDKIIYSEDMNIIMAHLVWVHMSEYYSLLQDDIISSHRRVLTSCGYIQESPDDPTVTIEVGDLITRTGDSIGKVRQGNTYEVYENSFNRICIKVNGKEWKPSLEGMEPIGKRLWDNGCWQLRKQIDQHIDKANQYFDKVNEALTKEETEMKDKTPVNIENKTFINGIESKDVSDDTVFDMIKKIEDQIKGLEDIQTKSKKVAAKIKSLQADIKGLVDFVDGRD